MRRLHPLVKLNAMVPQRKRVGVIFAVAGRGRVMAIENQEQKWYID